MFGRTVLQYLFRALVLQIKLVVFEMSNWIDAVGLFIAKVCSGGRYVCEQVKRVKWEPKSGGRASLRTRSAPTTLFLSTCTPDAHLYITSQQINLAHLHFPTPNFVNLNMNLIFVSFDTSVSACIHESANLRQ